MNDKLFSLPRKLILSHSTNDPFRIARNMGYDVKFLDLKKQKGFCTKIYNNYFIFINDNMSEQMKRMTCAHELGHIIFHKDQLGMDRNGNLKRFVEMELFDVKNRTEYEANLFAANLLIDKDELMEQLDAGYDIVSIASGFDVNVNLLAMLLAELSKKGLTISLPFIPDRTFMGHIADRADSV